MTPTVGRIVYYKSFGTPGGEHPSVDRAAVVTQVHNATCVDLCVLNPTGFFFNQNVVQGTKGGQWDWMPYQKEQVQQTGKAQASRSDFSVKEAGDTINIAGEDVPVI